MEVRRTIPRRVRARNGSDPISNGIGERKIIGEGATIDEGANVFDREANGIDREASTGQEDPR